MQWDDPLRSRLSGLFLRSSRCVHSPAALAVRVSQRSSSLERAFHLRRTKLFVRPGIRIRSAVWLWSCGQSFRRQTPTPGRLLIRVCAHEEYGDVNESTRGQHLITKETKVGNLRLCWHTARRRSPEACPSAPRSCGTGNPDERFFQILKRSEPGRICASIRCRYAIRMHCSPTRQQMCEDFLHKGGPGEVAFEREQRPSVCSELAVPVPRRGM